MTGTVWAQLHYASLLIALTFVVHAVMIVLARMTVMRGVEGDAGGPIVDTIRLVLLSVWLFVAHIIAIAMWAVLYLQVGLSPDVEESLYFSLTTYTTLGFGDIVPIQDWRLLTGASSANGLLLFGLSAAVLVDGTERLRGGYRH